MSGINVSQVATGIESGMRSDTKLLDIESHMASGRDKLMTRLAPPIDPLGVVYLLRCLVISKASFEHGLMPPTAKRTDRHGSSNNSAWFWITSSIVCPPPSSWFL
ncbi:hypothetical protein EVAR_101598_1 [Eumeta japonica]|uniref:Uncharacterized protein n=1 Tax=Eumeta variegata TaxID=151549 RepID=A0A4C1TN31_EUMVA|nr:hypothetical protein EVAR_101598_1 [Eumeta japonica]